jgi:hypothetical protein
MNMNTKIYFSLRLSALFLLFILAISPARSQTWSYDFGTGTGSWATAQGVNTTLLPQPPAGSGVSQLLIGAVAQGSGFYLNNPGWPALGSGSELLATASTGVAVNKFSIYGYNPSRVFNTSFDVLFANPDGQATPRAGEWYFYQGTGNLYFNTNNASTTLNQSFVSLRWSFSNGGVVRLAAHNGSAWVDLGLQSQARIYHIQIFGNNSTAPANYYHAGNMYTLANDRWDLWIDGVRAFSGLNSGGLANNVNIDSWLFAGEHSTTNYSSIFIDDVSYSNGLPGDPLPIQLISFAAEAVEGGVELNWQTATETNNDYFTVECSDASGEFLPVINVAGAGNSNGLLDYRVTHEKELTGPRYYRLKQTDFDGAYSYSEVVRVDPVSGDDALTILDLTVNEQGLQFFINGASGELNTEIWSVGGKLVWKGTLNAAGDGQRQLVPFQQPSSGIYILRLGNGESKVSKTFFAG